MHLLKHLPGWSKDRKFIRILHCGKTQYKTISEELQRKAMDVRAIRNHIAVEVIREACKAVDIDP